MQLLLQHFCRVAVQFMVHCGAFGAGCILAILLRSPLLHMGFKISSSLGKPMYVTRPECLGYEKDIAFKTGKAVMANEIRAPSPSPTDSTAFILAALNPTPLLAALNPTHCACCPKPHPLCLLP